jgi:predicted chitinase
MLTSEQLHAIMPDLPATKSAALFPFLTAAIDEFAIAAPARTAAFLAQLAHESSQFRFMEEIWGPTPAQKRYDPTSTLATSLGNTEAGDGRRFKGRGPIQITGRTNYTTYGGLLGLDLVGNPDRAALPDVAFRLAGLFWSKNGLNELADECTDTAFREITRRINGGFNGQDDRQRFYVLARTVLGVTAPTLTRGAQRPRLVPPAFGRGAEAIRSEARARRTRTRAKRTATKKGTHRKPPAVKKKSVKRSASRTKRR